VAEPKYRRLSLLPSLVLCIAFLALAAFSWRMLKLPAGELVVWLFWMPAGLVYAAVWRMGARAVPPLYLAGVVVGLVVSHLLGVPLGSALGISLISAAGAPLAALAARELLLRMGVLDPTADPRSLFAAILVACLLAPMLSACVGIASYIVAGPPVPLAALWVTWWVGEATGVLLVAPALLLLPQLLRLRLTPLRWLELMLLFAGVLLFWHQLFVVRSWPDAPPLAFLAVLPLIWAALRFPMAVVAWCAMLVALLVALSTLGGSGLFTRTDPVLAATYLNAFVITITGVGLTLGAAIAAQRRSIAALRQREMLLDELTEHSASLLWMSDGEGRIIYRSNAWRNLSGATPARSLQEWGERLHPADRDPARRFFEQARLGGERYEYEYRLIGADGSLRWLLDTGSARYDGDGRFTGFIGSTIDITTRKRSEAQLAVQAAVLRSLSFDIPLDRLLDDLARFVDAQLLGGCCEVMLADAEHGILRRGAGPNLPESFCRLLDCLPIGEGYGSSGTAAARRMVVVTDDVRSDPLWQPYQAQIADLDWLRACWSMPFSDSNYELLGVISIYCDQPRAPYPDEQELMRTAASLAAVVVQRSREAQRLRESEASLRATFQQAAVGVVQIGVVGGLRRVNQRFCDIVGYDEAELLSQDVGVLTHPDDYPMVLDARRQLLAGRDSISFEQRYIRRGGQSIWVRVWWSLVRDSSDMPDYFIAVVEDISERKRAEAEIERLALYDTLTDLPNRRLFLDRLQHALVTAQRGGQFGALLFIDLDHFKHLNDARGHHAGDMLLQQVAQRLLAGSRDVDTVARLGGDEFVILLEGLGDSLALATSGAGTVAEKVRRSLLQSFALEEGAYEHHVLASIGVTLFPKEGTSADELLKEADTAMYRAKAGGRNMICFYEPAMAQAAELRLALERDLRAAIGTDQLFLLLQPQQHVDGEIACAEALLRWNHPQRGEIPPATFIPVAEESGLITPLGEWVLGEAAKLMRQLDGADNRVEIAVNVSPRQFRDPDFVQRVAAILDGSGADPRRLLLEITEGVVMADVDDAIAKMSQLKQMGIRLSIDDFGVGYSSLSYLKRLPLHELKIDRTFVSDLPGDSNDVAIVETILAMARHLQLEVVAEGVENEEQYAFLKARGCRFFQGFHIARPALPDTVMPRLRAARHWI
jgi:diguanylate cyclase (GGDEF)-like protein/PAS domain S-box-containing protein